MNASAVSNKGVVAFHGYSFEEFPEEFDMYPFTDHRKFFHFMAGLTLICSLVKNYYYQKPRFDLN